METACVREILAQGRADLLSKSDAWIALCN